MKNKVISVLVVLYNKELLESATIQSLLEVDHSIQVNLTIINNGPSYLSGIEDFRISCFYLFKTINIVEHLDNKPLSKIYNDFLLESAASDYYLFFDDDSVFKPSYLYYISVSNAAIILPRIQSCNDNNFYYPISRNKVVTEEGVISAKDVISISSGLTISKGVVADICKFYRNVFDENFALYGIDTSFFLRLHHLNTLGKNFSIICHGIVHHSLSRANHQPITGFRFRERLCDAALIARHYPNKERVLYFFKKIVQNVLYFRLGNVLLLIKCYVLGKHPRCK